MDKTKMTFMRNAPTLVIVGGLGSLVFFWLVGVVTCFTSEWKFGIFVVCLCSLALVFLVCIIRRFEKANKMSISDAIARDKKRWE